MDAILQGMVKIFKGVSREKYRGRISTTNLNETGEGQLKEIWIVQDDVGGAGEYATVTINIDGQGAIVFNPNDMFSTSMPTLDTGVHPEVSAFQLKTLGHVGNRDRTYLPLFRNFHSSLVVTITKTAGFVILWDEFP